MWWFQERRPGPPGLLVINFEDHVSPGCLVINLGDEESSSVL